MKLLIREAQNGWEALVALRSDAPEMSGIDLLPKLNTEGPEVRFGLVTSEGTESMRERARREGALFLIARPFTAETCGSALTPVVLFNAVNTPEAHIQLGTMHATGPALPAPLKALWLKPGARVDLVVDVAGYASGKLSFFC